MTLIEAFVIDNVYIDFGSEIMYGDDQACIDYPTRFPTVVFYSVQVRKNTRDS